MFSVTNDLEPIEFSSGFILSADSHDKLERIDKTQLFRETFEPMKHVSFATKIEIIPIVSPMDQVDDNEVLWYETRDLQSFRREARNLCRKMRPFQSGSLALDESTRGLEQRVCWKRQKRKYHAIKDILRSQSALDRDQLAKLARQRSEWSEALARREAAHDFFRAYFSDQDPVECVKWLLTGDSAEVPESDQCSAIDSVPPF